jgi:hypothetical protein
MEGSVVLNSTVDRLARQVIRVVLQEVWGWVVKVNTAVIMVVKLVVIMVVREPWVEWAEVNSVEVREDRAGDLTVVAEALAAGRRVRGSSIAVSYQIQDTMPRSSVCVGHGSICKCPGVASVIAGLPSKIVIMPISLHIRRQCDVKVHPRDHVVSTN